MSDETTLPITTITPSTVKCDDGNETEEEDVGA